MKNYKPHHVTFVAHLIKSGLFDPRLGSMDRGLLSDAVDLLAQDGPAAAPTKLPPAAKVALERLASSEVGCVALGSLDGRVRRGVLNLGLVEEFTVESPSEVRRLLSLSEAVAVDEPVKFLRLTEAGRAALA